MAKTITIQRSSNEIVRRWNSMVSSTMVPETDRHAPTPGAEFETERPDAEEICARVARIIALLRVSCPLYMDKRKRPARRHPNSAGLRSAVTEACRGLNGRLPRGRPVFGPRRGPPGRGALRGGGRPLSLPQEGHDRRPSFVNDLNGWRGKSPPWITGTAPNSRRGTGGRRYRRCRRH